MMTIRFYEEERDYETILGWWKHRGWDGLHPSFLKPLGAVAEDNGELIAASWLYPIAGCGLALMEWTVSKPKASGFMVAKAITRLTMFFEQWCQDSGYQVMITTCRQESMSRLHKMNGFEVTDREMIHMIKKVGAD